MGHRSPEGLAINPANGELWETEHGPQGGDELNKIEPGKNYGWPVISHGIDYNNSPDHGRHRREGGDGAAALLLESGDRAVGYGVLSGQPVPGMEGQHVRRAAWAHKLLDRLHMDWKTNKVIGEEPLLLEPGISRPYSRRALRTGWHDLCADGFEPAGDGENVSDHAEELK